LPPKWGRNLDRLKAFLDVLPPDLVHVIEFRNRDWLCHETYGLLAEHGICLCVHDMLHRHPRQLTGPAVYIRFHGAGSLYGGNYRTSRLRGWADWILASAEQREVFAYFNNDANAYAVRNALSLRQMVLPEGV
jgi:uncharacterized protein YecE (DUF72 family)